MKFSKYHALGNDYLVLDSRLHPDTPDSHSIRRICHRHYGLGSDGILHGPLEAPDADFGLRIFNPDGSEAEKSGNGLRIFVRFLWDKGLVQENTAFTIRTAGGRVTCCLRDQGREITVEMGQVTFRSSEIPVGGNDREVLDEALTLEGQTFRIFCASVGNPHCVIPLPEISPEMARRFGPLIERHPLFPNRTNVQFLQVLNRNAIRIEIWERGAGYTLASGSSSSASAAVAYKTGACDENITVHMPGGTLAIRIDPKDHSILMTGPATCVGEYTMHPEVLTQEVPL